jgi:hypothetical protein
VGRTEIDPGAAATAQCGRLLRKVRPKSASSLMAGEEWTALRTCPLFPSHYYGYDGALIAPRSLARSVQTTEEVAGLGNIII